MQKYFFFLKIHVCLFIIFRIFGKNGYFSYFCPHENNTADFYLQLSRCFESVFGKYYEADEDAR